MYVGWGVGPMKQQWAIMSWREKQLWFLIFLSAGAAIPQYIMQSVLIAPGGIAMLPNWFWTADAVMWALRAIVESWVICYLFTTRSGSFWQKAMQLALAVIEVGLLYLIIITAGEAIRAVHLGTTPTSPIPWLPWEWALASYTSLMMAGAGFAYRVQPDDMHTKDQYAEHIQLLEEDVLERSGVNTELSDTVAELSAENEERSTEIQTLKAAIEQMHNMGAWFDDLDATNRARLLARTLDKDKLPPPRILAEAWGVSPSTIVKAYNAKGSD